ncbi:hypothetical protein JTE90_013095 [Oedothorax gibbosus]|uniref:Uncharacterized protein n=1 Tax=Oedothorax gibbosus TaxID=931172 RepID=A0AAV6ULZ6_9ARAC|nr:hypothetical protein JTE90_013095 [Oedothorax gibbosus]
MDTNNLPAYNYSGDAELQRLKIELDDEEQSNNLILNEAASGQNSESNMKLEENDGIEENEMASVKDDCSSGVSSCSDVSSDSFTKNGDKKFENRIPLCQDDNSTMDASKAETLQLKNSKSGISGEDEICRNDSNDLLKQENNEKTDSANEAAIHPRAVFKTLPPELKGTIKFRESKPCEFIIPLIGKSVDWGKDQKPMPFDAELAARINQQNFINNGGPRRNTSFQEYIRKKQARTKEEIEEEDQRLELRAARMATYVLSNTVRILLQMESDEPNEDKIVKYFIRFLRLPISPFDMIHMPQFVRTVMFVKGCREFSKRVRDIAKECYDKIHVLFPIPPGYNFITVYTNEVEKCLPFDCDKMSDYPLVYESSENEDSEKEKEDSENENEDSENENKDSAFSDDQGVDD